MVCLNPFENGSCPLTKPGQLSIYDIPYERGLDMPIENRNFALAKV